MSNSTIQAVNKRLGTVAPSVDFIVYEAPPLCPHNSVFDTLVVEYSGYQLSTRHPGISEKLLRNAVRFSSREAGEEMRVVVFKESEPHKYSDEQLASIALDVQSVISGNSEIQLAKRVLNTIARSAVSREDKDFLAGIANILK